MNRKKAAGDDVESNGSEGSSSAATRGKEGRVRL